MSLNTATLQCTRSHLKEMVLRVPVEMPLHLHLLLISITGACSIDTREVRKRRLGIRP